MTFITGSITSANPGVDLYNAIATAALADGWTLDDTVVIGGNTHKVLKSAAAGNTYALDWYLDINYPTTGVTGGIRFAPFEGYTAASDVGLRGPYTAAGSTIDATTYSRFGATTSALETNWVNTASHTGLSTALTTSAFTYWISITRNRIIVMLSNVSTTVAYAGFFTPSAAHSAHAGAAMFPLVMTVVAQTGVATASATAGNTAAAFTRIPKASSLASWGTTAAIGGANGLNANFSSGQAGTAVSPFTGESTIAPLAVTMSNSSISAPSTTNPTSWVGTLDGLDAGFVSSSAVRGDALTIGSDSWYVLSPSNSFGVFLKGV